MSRGNESDPALAGFNTSSWRDDVAGRQYLGEISRTQSIGREPILRIIQIDGLRQNAPPLYLGNFGSALQRSSNQVRKIIELGIAVFVAGNGSQFRSRLGRIADDHRLPGVGMQLGSF